MDHNESQSHIKENVLQNIRNGTVGMHSNSYFTLKVVLLLILTAVIFFISVFICTFILFSLRTSNHNELLGFGTKGFFLFIVFFPWRLFIVDVFLVFYLDRLLRKFSLGYKSSILYVLLGSVILITSAAFAIDRGTLLNDRILDRADHEKLPRPIGVFYKRSHSLTPPESGICRCVVIDIKNGIIRAQDPRLGTTTFTTIFVSNNTEQATTSGLRSGDVIFVAGTRENNGIRAFGIRKVQGASN